MKQNNDIISYKVEVKINTDDLMLETIMKIDKALSSQNFKDYEIKIMEENNE